jgi:HSP20 family molecular chaperone IbpA
VNPEQTKANYRNGLLKIEVPFKDAMKGAIDIKIE